MGILTRKDRKEAPDKPVRARTLLAAAMPLAGREGKQAWQNSTSDVNWQKTAWYYYDAVGELRFAFNWLANAVSRATLYAAETDPETGLITEATDDPRAQAVANSILGGPEARPEFLSMMALHWQVSGETYILVVPQGGAKPDRWMVLSRNGLRERGGRWSFKDPLTGVWSVLRDGTDRVIRVWSPHPDDPVHADSAMRPGTVICQEIEKASQNITARLDSRLAGNGILFLPQELDFPTSDGEPADAQSFMKLLLEASEAGIANPGTAAAHVPIMAQVPAEFLAALANGHVDLSTAMDGTVPELREGAITRLGRTLDMPREIALGQVAEANHWSAWQVEETTYKIHVEPFLLKLGMTLTTEFFRAAYTAMGGTNPERFVLAWDITEVVSRPDDTEDVKYLLENNLVSQDWVRSKFSVPDDAVPSEEEARKNLARVLATSAPTVLENPSVAAALGFEPTTAPGAAVSADSSGVPADTNTPALPARDTAPPEPDQGLVAAAELIVFDALSRAGGRLLTPAFRGQFKATPRHELHTVIPVDGRASQLMEGSFQFIDPVASAFGLSPGALRAELRAYVENQLMWGEAHDPQILIRYLRQVPRA